MAAPRVTEVLPGVWTAEVATSDFEVRAALLLGDGRALVFDTLMHPSDMAPFAELVGDRALTTVYSHADWDHIWGTSGLPESGGEVVGQAACAERFRAEVPRTLARRRAEEPGVWDDIELVAPSAVFEERSRIDLGSLSVELHHLPGHTRDSVVAWVPELGLLLTGDAAEDPWPLSEEGLPLAPWMDGLERWASQPGLALVIPSHGPLAGRELLERNWSYLRALKDGRLYPIPDGTDPFYLEHHERDRRRYGNPR